ncbi:Abscisic acid 8'-hydroxylase 1 [Apostasia shenzhenica]|uniref:(+)-abscisic acid 8'-hydroxylase n=1 Tax=Apostasia shenzhenica TaxID=1088818 RepID=A0A2I0B8K2_9ASPA|nr:Abscisic acid 8'-hydroxylase 1 [Apostasia shenzhenica]
MEYCSNIMALFVGGSPAGASTTLRMSAMSALAAALVVTAAVCLLSRMIWMRIISPQAVRDGVSGRIAKQLPPGSMGWPYLGETFQLYSNNPSCFFEERQSKYGAIFKTRILGCPCIMVSSPEAARFVLITKAHLFKPTFPKSKERMLGPQAIFFQQGEYHAKLRRLVLRAFMPDAIRAKIPAIEEIALRHLSSWEGRFINAYLEMKTYAMNVALLSIFGKEEQSYVEELKQCYYTLEKGYNSMPFNFPGTLFHKAMKARRQLGLIVARIMSRRRERGAHHHHHHSDDNDLLASFMGEEALTDEQIADNIIGVIFAARDTTASVLTWILKYLAENPSILQAVTEEQEELIRRRGETMGALNWSDTRSMPITCRVIQETLRVASILTFTFREAVQSVEYEGFLIPKGWKVLPLFRIIHHSPENFPDPEKFDPSRFEVSPRPNTYLPFGNGTHACPGNELAKLEMLVLLHHLTTKYRWSLSGSGSGIQFRPFALPLNGLPIKIDRSQNVQQLKI